MRNRMFAAPLALCCALLPSGCGPRTEPPARRAILVSFDSFNPTRFQATLDAAVIPAFTRLFREGACAPYVLTQWATQTPMAHAAIWTGAFAHVNGVGRQEAALPEHAWTWLERRPPASLYAAGHLAAEPLWITAGRQGVSVFAHHPTHAPDPPSYRDLGMRIPDSTLAAWREEAARTLAREDVRVMNGYNRRHPQRVITESTHPARPAPPWAGRDAQAAALEIAWDAGPDSLFALLPGDGSMLVAPARDMARAIAVRAVPAPEISASGDTAAAAFAGPILLHEDDTPVAVSVRLFRLAADAESYTLYQTGAEVIESNRPELTAAYVEATGGWIGNAYGSGLGEWLGRGGDGAAEARQLDVYAFLTRQWLRGTRWAWGHQPDLLIDYNPSADSYDHDWYGWIADGAPAHDPDLGRVVQRVREAGFALLDRHLALLMELAEATPGTILFVTSDHGMRPVWQTVHPNAILADAGLLALDAEGEIDLSRTRALSPDGWGIVVNRASRRSGIVPDTAVDAVVRAARTALENARDAEDRPLVERLYSQAALDSLFGSGPAANEIYIGWRQGLQGRADVPLDAAGAPTAIQPLPWPRGDHGATLPWTEGMAGFCAFGPTVSPGTLPLMRQTDIAPTVADWMDIEPPRHTTGRSVLGEILREGR